MTHNLESYEPTFTRTPEDYRPFIGPVRVEQLKRLAGACEGKSWVSVNSTLEGGGRGGEASQRCTAGPRAGH